TAPPLRCAADVTVFDRSGESGPCRSVSGRQEPIRNAATHNPVNITTRARTPATPRQVPDSTCEEVTAPRPRRHRTPCSEVCTTPWLPIVPEHTVRLCQFRRAGMTDPAERGQYRRAPCAQIHHAQGC